jgi:hypothetical protein
MKKPTKEKLAAELSRYTGLSKSHYIKNMKKDQIEAALDEVNRQGLRPKKGKHVYLLNTPIRSSRRRRSRGTPVKGPSKKYLIDEIVRYTGRPKARYKDWEKRALMQRLEELHDSGTRPLRGKVVKIKYPRQSTRSRSRGLTKKDLIDDIVRYTGRPKVIYNKWEKEAIEQRLYALKDSGARPLRGKVVKLGTPRRKSRSRRSRSKSTTKVQCKSYQVRNERGRCVNKPCKPGRIRDRETKKCRKKKSK